MPPAGAWVDTIDYSFANSPAVQAFDWIGCIVFFASAVLLGSKLYTFKPEVLSLLRQALTCRHSPDRHRADRQTQCLLLTLTLCTTGQACTVLLWLREGTGHVPGLRPGRGLHSVLGEGQRAGICFCYGLHSHAKSDTWALQVCNHLSGVEGSQLYTYRYVDYIGTCPLLTLTLCATLNLPYKLTSAIFMLLVIVAGLMAFWSPAPGRYVWFGLGCVIFAFTWYRIVTLSQVRFLQYFGKKHRITYRVGNSQKSKRRESFATKAGLRDKRVRGPIQMFLGTYFIVWTGEAWMLATDQAGET